MHQNNQKFLQTARHRPGVGEQQFDQGFFLVGRAAPEQGYGHNLDILFRVFQSEANQIGKLPGRHRLVPTAPKQAANAFVKEEKRMRGPILHRQGVGGAGQPCPDDFLLQHQAARQRAVLEHVTDGLVRVQPEGFQGIATDISPDP